MPEESKGIIQKVFEAVGAGQPKDDEKGKQYLRIDSVEQGHNILAAVAKEHESGKHRADVEVNTAVEADMIKFLNYAVSLLPEKYALHKMLLILRVNPVKYNPAGEGIYLSKKYIAQQLTQNTKKQILEVEIDRLEKEAIRIVQDSIRSTRADSIPILNA